MLKPPRRRAKTAAAQTHAGRPPIAIVRIGILRKESALRRV